MTVLTILSYSQLHYLLLSLSRDDIVSLQRNIAEALREYSTGSQYQGCSAEYQPRRTAITRLNGCTTLFMPATTGQTLGIKMISLQDGDTAGSSVESGSSVAPRNRRLDDNQRSTSPEDSAGRSSSSARRNSSSSVNSSNSEAFETSSAETDEFSLRKGTASVNDQGLSETMGAWPGVGARDTSPQGSVVLLNGEGLPFGLINALDLTAFRTALASMLLFNKRRKVRTMAVFGAGHQAYWHIRLALSLRGSDIKRVYIINRSFDRAAKLLREIYSPENSNWRGDVKFTALSRDFVEYKRILRSAVHKADAIFCCTPSIEPLFPAQLLTSRQGRQKGRFICAVGSYKPHMTELHPDILRDEVTLQAPQPRFQKHTTPSGVVVVDSLNAALKEAGEIAQADITPRQMVELGELLMVREESQETVASLETDTQRGREEANLRKWIQKGNVIYKSVGLGLMDVVTGGDLVALAQQRGVGTVVENF